jgi:hypothetical protein
MGREHLCGELGPPKLGDFDCHAAVRYEPWGADIPSRAARGSTNRKATCGPLPRSRSCRSRLPTRAYVHATAAFAAGLSLPRRSKAAGSGGPRACRSSEPEMRETPAVGDGRGLSARGRTPAETSALDGNPIEHGNIQVFEPGGQNRHRAMGLRHHDLRIRDHGVERFDHGVVTARASWGAPYPHRIVCTKAAFRMVDEVLKGARANWGRACTLATMKPGSALSIIRPEKRETPAVGMHCRGLRRACGRRSSSGGSLKPGAS